ncbi:MAG: GNAT family acetyltransferase [Pseudomonadota bacterium]
MATNFLVRAYQDQDHSELVELWEACFPNDPHWNNPVEVIKTKLTVQPELLFVCISDDRVVGSVLAGFEGFRGWVNKVATHPDYQRRGIASALMKTAEGALAAMGCPKLNLQVRAGNAASVEFYRSLGYEIEERVSMGKRLQ